MCMASVSRLKLFLQCWRSWSRYTRYAPLFKSYWGIEIILQGRRNSHSSKIYVRIADPTNPLIDDFIYECTYLSLRSAETGLDLQCFVLPFVDHILVSALQLQIYRSCPLLHHLWNLFPNWVSLEIKKRPWKGFQKLSVPAWVLGQRSLEVLWELYDLYFCAAWYWSCRGVVSVLASSLANPDVSSESSCCNQRESDNSSWSCSFARYTAYCGCQWSCEAHRCSRPCQLCA